MKEEQLELDLTLPKEQTLEELIERIENYPCSMSCYSTIAEMKSAQSMKQSILQILKGG